MAKIKVTAFKKSGKYYTEEIYELEGFPSNFNVPDNTTISELRKMQIEETCRILGEIEKGNMTCYCPVNNWKGFYFILDGIFGDNESGFLTYLLDKTNEG